MEKQTAIDWLIIELEEHGFKHLDLAQDIITEAKYIEKQQIIEAHCDGQSEFVIEASTTEAKEYYNKTFNQ